MWDSNPRTILWISWMLYLCTVGFAEKVLDDTDGIQPTENLLAGDESVINFQPRDEKSYANLQYELIRHPNESSLNDESGEISDNSDEDNLGPDNSETGNANETQSRMGLGFLFGNPFSFLSKPTRRIPTVENKNRKSSTSQAHTRKKNNMSANKRPNNKQAQRQSNRQEWDTNPQQSIVQPSGWNSQLNAFNRNPIQNNGQFFLQNEQNGGAVVSSWETTSTIPSNWHNPSTSWMSQHQSSNNNNNNHNNNNWQQNMNNGNSQTNWFNEDKPSWGSSSQSWTKRPSSSWQQTTSTTTKGSNWWGGNGDDQAPVWTERPTPGRYKPSPTKKPQRKSISELKCEEYSKPFTQTINALPLSLDPELLSINVDKCDRNAQALIVGGQRAELGEFPHMVAVGFRTKRGISWSCGGSLISENYVLTAAHCTDSNLGKPVAVRCGELNLVRNDDGASPTNYKVVQVINHQDYQSSKKYNDIALLRLDRSVEFTDMIRPACLHTMDSISESRALATGWGSIGFGDQSSDTLLKVNLNLIDNRKCSKLYRADSSLQRGIVNSQVCAGDLQYGGHDTCLGDSGGPLQVTSHENRCIYKIVGITSFGKFCGESSSPGVYTRVSSFVPWIESIVWP